MAMIGSDPGTSIRLMSRVLFGIEDDQLPPIVPLGVNTLVPTKWLQHMEEELKVTNRLLEARDKLLQEIPPCPLHGNECIPHAREWIQAAITLLDEAGLSPEEWIRMQREKL